MHEPPWNSVLLIGYGNPLRRDDGVGQAVARAVERWHHAALKVLAIHQLTPELAEDLARVQLAIFVDACAAGECESVSVKALSPRTTGISLSHVCEPRMLLALALALHGCCPLSWHITVPANDFKPGEGLSSLAQRGLRAALEEIARLIERPVKPD